MTTMALTAPPLKRLFERLDFSPTPTQDVLKVVMEQWKLAGRGVVAPSRSAVRFPEESEAAKRIFVYRVRGRRTRLHAGRWGEGQRRASWAM